MPGTRPGMTEVGASLVLTRTREGDATAGERSHHSAVPLEASPFGLPATVTSMPPP